MNANDFIWLNVARDSYEAIAGTTSFEFITKYFDMTSVMNVHELFSMMASEIVDDVTDAEVIVSDKATDVVRDVEVIRSFDTEKILALMN